MRWVETQIKSIGGFVVRINMFGLITCEAQRMYGAKHHYIFKDSPRHCFWLEIHKIISLYLKHHVKINKTMLRILDQHRCGLFVDTELLPEYLQFMTNRSDMVSPNLKYLKIQFTKQFMRCCSRALIILISIYKVAIIAST